MPGPWILAGLVVNEEKLTVPLGLYTVSFPIFRQPRPAYQEIIKKKNKADFTVKEIISLAVKYSFFALFVLQLASD